MEASVQTVRRLDGVRAQRIVAAMRDSVGVRGAAASTFDVVAAEAGVSRGLLHYYFGTKERLLIEVVRTDCEERIAALEAGLAHANDIEAIVATLAASVRSFVEDEPGAPAVLHEMISASRHSEDIRAELAEVYRRWRAHLADALRAKETEGIVALDADADSVAAVLFALGDGMGLQLLSDDGWSSGRALGLGERTARRLLGARD